MPLRSRKPGLPIGFVLPVQDRGVQQVERQPLRTFPFPAGLDPKQRMKLAVERTEKAMTCVKERPAEAVGMLEQAERQLGQARGTLSAGVQPRWWDDGWGSECVG